MKNIPEISCQILICKWTFTQSVLRVCTFSKICTQILILSLLTLIYGQCWNEILCLLVSSILDSTSATILISQNKTVSERFTLSSFESLSDHREIDLFVFVMLYCLLHLYFWWILLRMEFQFPFALIISNFAKFAESSK